MYYSPNPVLKQSNAFTHMYTGYGHFFSLSLFWLSEHDEKYETRAACIGVFIFHKEFIDVIVQNHLIQMSYITSACKATGS